MRNCLKLFPLMTGLSAGAYGAGDGLGSSYVHSLEATFSRRFAKVRRCSRSPPGMRPVTSFKAGWIKVRQKAGVKGRWHDNRHTLVTELAESGAGDEVIMSIAGHVPRAMLSYYSHVRMEAKRRALDGIGYQQCRTSFSRGRGSSAFVPAFQTSASVTADGS
jgi:Phage integrase family